ncbi:hypothetical protein HBN50_03635 [Halobacteriovorax sp. GB3]|uniref:hypothetical protein n=1 Tax=Halobacteriovorax sp. GB3 TaxID=2719615 RepID=UPI00235E9EF3|nr:hypothetical protein [Halobacteriovorax sp. GB3]MDD0852170.1 hypothetical protein [Halobacteriovorax sp. GB3]
MKLWPLLAILLTQASLASSYFVAPFYLSLNGIEPFYGAAAGMKGLTKRKFDIVAGASFGSLEGAGLSLSNYQLTANDRIGLNFLNISDVKYETNYGRGLTTTDFVNQKLEFQAIQLNYSRLLSKSLTVKFNIAMTQRKFKGYETLDEREIDITLKNFYDEKATILGPAISYKTDLFKASADLGYIFGRTGQSDMLLLNTSLWKAIPLSSNNALNFGMKSSHAFVASEFQTKDNEIDGDCELITNSELQQRCLQLESDTNKFIKAHNRYGTAKPLGGNFGLRSFREFEFKSAHNLLLSSEFQQRLIGEKLYGLIFFELGQAQDRFEKIMNSSRFSSGAALHYYVSEKMPLRITYARGNSGDQFFISAGSIW